MDYRSGKFKTVIIAHDLTAEDTFTSNINLPFAPKLMKVKNCQYRYLQTDAGVESGMIILELEGLGKICAFGDGQTNMNELVFDVSGLNIQNTIKLRTVDESGALNSDSDGVLVLSLEFSTW